MLRVAAALRGPLAAVCGAAVGREECHRLEAVRVEEVDVVVIGGGIAGASCAYHLCGTHGKRVVVLEQGSIACEATGLSAGTLWCGGPAREPAVYDALAEFSMRSYRAAEARDPGCCGLVACGAISLVSDAPGEVEDARAQVADFERRGLDAVFLSRAALVEAEPALGGGGAVAGILTPRSGYVDPGRAARAFADQSAASILEAEAARTVRVVGGACECATSAGRVFRAADVVVANGSGAAALLRASLGLAVPVSPVRGQIWVASTKLDGDGAEIATPPALRRVVYSHGSAVAYKTVATVPAKCTHVRGERRVRHLYGRPRSDCDGYLFGGDRVPVGSVAAGYETFDESTASSRSHAAQLVGDSVVGDHLDVDGAWSGPMPFSEDGLPLVGHLGTLGLPNVWILDGFGPSGMTLAPGAAEGLASAIAGEPHPLRALLRDHCDPCRPRGGVSLA